MPAEAWGAIGLIGGGALTAFIAWINSKRTQKQDAGTLALEMVKRLDARVEILERERNAYRSWSHVLWTHIYDEQAPRLPAPTWPIDLAR